MNRIKIAGSILVLILAVCTSMSYAVTEIRVLTDRTPSHLNALINDFEKKTGIKINALHVDKGLISRLTSRPTEADVVITKTINILEIAKQKGLLRPFSSPKLMEGLRLELRDPQNHYFTTSYRGRVIYYSKDRVKTEALSTYQDLASEDWKGRICIRSGYHNYNLGLFAQMAEAIGLDRTRMFIKGLHANLARAPKGNDRAQIRAIYEGECDVAIANSYYMGIMLSREDQRNWGLATKVFFPNQKEGGAYVMRGGAALTTATVNKKAATMFLEYLIDDYAQDYFSNAIYAYSINDKRPLAKVNQQLGDGQKEVVKGKFKANFVPLQGIESHREAIIIILNEIDFDNK